MKIKDLKIGEIVKINGEDQAIIGFLSDFVLTVNQSYDRSAIHLEDINTCEKSDIDMNKKLINNFIKINDLQNQIQSLEADTFEERDFLISA